MSLSDEETLFDDTNEADLNDIDEETDFYAILNIPKNATNDEINSAYKRRSLIFHPDRHIDEEDKREASKIFIRLKKAHETLTDTQLRAIYDTLGVRGINLQGWQLISRTTNPENIRKEYEFLNRLRENEIMLQRVHPGSSFIVQSSIAGMFQQNSLEKFSLSGMTLSQSVDCALTDADRVGCAGRVRFDENGLGDGSVQFSYKRALFASTHIESYFAAGPNHISGSMKLSLTCLTDSINRLSWLNGTTLILQPTLKYHTFNGYDPSLTPIFIYPLSPNNQGAISFNIGAKRFHSLTISYIYSQLNQPKFVLNIMISPISPSVRVVYHKHYPQHDQHIEANCLFSLKPLSIAPTITWERHWTKYSKIGIKINLSFPTCFLQAALKIKTSLNNYEFRLVFCEQSDEFICAGVSLFMSGLALTGFSLLLRWRFPKLMRIFDGERIDEMGFEAKKEQAQKAIHLMRETAEKVAREEERKKGLIIVEAQYGQMVNDIPGSELYPLAGEKLADVTIPLQAMVNDSQLRVYSGKDLPGFYDPCPGEPKMLKVIYRFQDRLHATTVTEEQPLLLPMRAHCIIPN